MGANQYNRRPPINKGGTIIGAGGVQLGSIKKYTVAVDPANQASAATFKTSVTVTGAPADGIVVGVQAPAALEANLAFGGATVSAADTVILTLHALAAVDGASRSWVFLIADPA